MLLLLLCYSITLNQLFKCTNKQYGGGTLFIWYLVRGGVIVPIGDLNRLEYGTGWRGHLTSIYGIPNIFVYTHCFGNLKDEVDFCTALN